MDTSPGLWAGMSVEVRFGIFLVVLSAALFVLIMLFRVAWQMFSGILSSWQEAREDRLYEAMTLSLPVKAVAALPGPAAAVSQEPHDDPTPAVETNALIAIRPLLRRLATSLAAMANVADDRRTELKQQSRIQPRLTADDLEALKFWLNRSSVQPSEVPVVVDQALGRQVGDVLSAAKKWRYELEQLKPLAEPDGLDEAWQEVLEDRLAEIASMARDAELAVRAVLPGPGFEGDRAYSGEDRSRPRLVVSSDTRSSPRAIVQDDEPIMRNRDRV